jgi:predicted enzyme related to lactoylglutathione lyase
LGSGREGVALIWLNVPSEPTVEVQQGVIVHCQVEDVTAAADLARAAGAAILREPTRMDFGMESAWTQVEGGPIVDLTRPL